MSEFVPRWELRRRFAHGLSVGYGREVPAYQQLVEVAHEVNEAVVAALGGAALRLGSIERVTAERHGAIRVGTPDELAQVARIFAACGMFPTGFYDLREAQPTPIPIVSTAFRPLESEELAKNPFRVFTSVLVPQDRRFFDADTERRLQDVLARRQIFPPELLELADRSVAEDGLAARDADRFLSLARSAFALSPEPVDYAWYSHLEGISSVAADIGGVNSTHINHLTPRVLDIDALYMSMQERGITMIERIEGPPRWYGPEVLLRQTSFRALAEPRLFRNADGSTFEGALKVRFGEVEARGVALTPAGRSHYDAMIAEVDQREAAGEMGTRVEIARQVWQRALPDSELGLALADYAYYRLDVVPGRAASGGVPTRDLEHLVRDGWVTLSPIVYEDFLPRSAAGIFSSNLTSDGSMDIKQQGMARDRGWIADAIGADVTDPFSVYAAQREQSWRAVVAELDLSGPIEVRAS